MGNAQAYWWSYGGPQTQYEYDEEMTESCKSCKKSSMFAIKEFMFLCEHLPDHRHKLRVIEDMLKFVQMNTFLITHYFNFRETLRKRVLHFIAEDNIGDTRVLDPLYEDLFGCTPDLEEAQRRRTQDCNCFYAADKEE
jgi:hypothetical protein